MIRIRLFLDFGTEENAINAIRGVYGIDNDIIFVQDDSYTHAIIFNTVMPNLKIPKENVLGLAFEPPNFLNMSSYFVEWCKNNVGLYLIGTSNLPDPFINHFAFLWFSQDRNYKGDKKLMAIWCSQKTFSFGHKYRHMLIREILKTNLPIDIWGKGVAYYNSSDSRLKGEFYNEEPYRDYKFCVTIENFVTDDYISEKLLNCITYNTTPIYMGAKNVNRYFGDCYYSLSGDIATDMNMLKDILQNPRQKDLTYARQQLFEGKANLNKFIKNHWLQ